VIEKVTIRGIMSCGILKERGRRLIGDDGSVHRMWIMGIGTMNAFEACGCTVLFLEIA
jgi:hypothetical protein